MKFSIPLSDFQQDRYGTLVGDILAYYPLGIKGELPIYRESEQYKKLEDIVVENIHNKKNYRERWTTFEREIKKTLNCKLEGCTYPTDAGFSSKIILKEFQHQELFHEKSLYFSVSFIGPFYTVFGMDETSIIDEGRHYSSKNVVTASPYKEFENIFNLIDEKIRKRFDGYKFVPFVLHSMVMGNLYDLYENDKELSIYKALFNSVLDGYETLKNRGDAHYGMDNWRGSDNGPTIAVRLGPPTGS